MIGALATLWLIAASGAACPEFLPVDPVFEAKLALVATSWPRASALERAIATKEIVDLTFSDPGAYESRLCRLDREAEASPQSVVTIARRAQDRWEITYGVESAERVTVRANARASFGLSVAALAVIGAASVKRPDLVPRYFSLFRKIVPAGRRWVALSSLWVLGSASVAWSARDPHGLPPSPAHVMRLGLPSEEEEVIESEFFVDEMATLAASVGVSLTAYRLLAAARALKSTSVATGPVRLHPVALAGGIVAGYAADAIAREGVEAWEERSRGRDLIREARAVLSELRASRRASAYAAGDRLARAASSLAGYAAREGIEADRDLAEAFAAIEGLRGTAEYDSELARIEAKRARVGAKLRAQPEYSKDLDLELLGAMSGFAVGARVDSRAGAALEKGFAQYRASRESQGGSAPGGEELTEWRADFLSRARAEHAKRLAAEIEGGIARSHVTHPLVAAAGFLRALPRDRGEDFLELTAEELDAEALRTVWLLEAVR